MRSIVNYGYYVEEYKGTLIPSNSFDALEIKATRDFNYFTGSKISSEIQITQDIQDVICEICELKYQQEQLKEKTLNNKIVQSETVGSHSISYVNNENNKITQILSDEEMLSKEYQICLIGLVDKNLMCRGLR